MTTNLQWRKIEDLRPYEKNPRDNSDAVPLVAASIKEFGFKVPIVVDGDGVIVCGHTRYAAAQSLGMTEVPVIVADDLTPEQIKAFRLADNKVSEVSRWDTAFLIEELEDLSAFEIDMEDFGFDVSEIGRRRASWARTEKYCDLKRRIKQHFHSGMVISTLYETGKRGIPIAQIKENQNNAPLFADNLVDYLEQVLGNNLASGEWCLVTTPRRRHKTGFHFSTEICKVAARMLNLPFYEGAFIAEDRNRIEPTFYMVKNPPDKNVILYDDVITTGQTIRATRQLLLDTKHIVLAIIGIKN